MTFFVVADVMKKKCNVPVPWALRPTASLIMNSFLCFRGFLEGEEYIFVRMEFGCKNFNCSCKIEFFKYFYGKIIRILAPLFAVKLTDYIILKINKFIYFSSAGEQIEILLSNCATIFFYPKHHQNYSIKA